MRPSKNPIAVSNVEKKASAHNAWPTNQPATDMWWYFERIS